MRKQFLAPRHENSVRSVKTGFYASNGPFWSKKFLFENRSILETSSYLEQQDFIFFVGKLSAGLSKLHFVFLLEHSEKNKNFLRKNFFLYFLNLGWRIFGFPTEKKPYGYQKCKVRVPRTIWKRQMFFWKIDGLRNTFGLWAKTFQSFVDHFFARFLKLHSICSY